MCAVPSDTGEILLTGATGLLGSGILRRLLERPGDAPVHVLARDVSRFPAAVRNHPRVHAIRGNVTRPGAGIGPEQRRRLSGAVGLVIHAAADTRFSQSAEQAWSTNVQGTRNLLDVSCGWRPPPRFVLVSTAFVAGRRTGVISEDAVIPGEGWVNEYERSKHHAEAAVSESGLSWVVCRSSTVVCDAPTGEVTQINGVHRALRVCHRGLAPMLPGDDASPVDVVPADYVSRAVEALSLRPEAEGRTFHLAAGDDALPLGELFDITYAVWDSLGGRRRPVVRPVVTDLETYRLFEASVMETAEPRLQRVTRSLSHFVPQLAYPKRFCTSGADALLDFRPPPVREYWPRMLDSLAKRWSRAPQRPGSVS